MGGRDGHTVSRRRILGLAGAGWGRPCSGPGSWGAVPGRERSYRAAARSRAGTGRTAGNSKGGGFTTPPPGTAPEPLWKAAAANTGLAGIEALAVIGGVALVSGDPLVGRSMATGKETWRSRLGKKYQQPRPVAADDRHVYVIAGILEKDFTTPNNVIAANDTTSGRIAWREQRDAGTEEFGITAAAVDGRLVYTDYRENVTPQRTSGGQGRRGDGKLRWTYNEKSGDIQQWYVAAAARPTGRDAREAALRAPRRAIR
ncbi:PQQ-binding-like beta-propeller repeat protein, partial [Streptomyces sp. NPDC088184]|uniref:outer membrane protein assembly factor BamB family protein n=1 Tax=Streptomyces sp. NPDC088184 TaxID=3160991 RepID=UPI0034176463